MPMMPANRDDDTGLLRKLAYDLYKLRAADRSQACFGFLGSTPTSSSNNSKPGALSSFAAYLPARKQRTGDGRDPRAYPQASHDQDARVHNACDDRDDRPRRRPSAASTLSTESLSSAAEPTPRRRAQRRHSCPTIDPPHDVEAPRPVLRQKFRPRHRSASLNDAVSGIIRPSRYPPSEDHLQQLQNGQRRRSSWSSGGRSSTPSLTGTTISDASSHSNESWVPLGVDFKACVEVYLFDSLIGCDE